MVACSTFRLSIWNLAPCKLQRYHQWVRNDVCDSFSLLIATKWNKQTKKGNKTQPKFHGELAALFSFSRWQLSLFAVVCSSSLWIDSLRLNSNTEEFWPKRFDTCENRVKFNNCSVKHLFLSHKNQITFGFVSLCWFCV